MSKAELERELIRGFLADELCAHNMINSWITSVLDLRSWHKSIKASRDDIRQNVLMALTENFRHNKYRGKGLKTYVSAITKFICLKAYDRKEVTALNESETTAGQSSKLDEIIREEDFDQIRKAISQLAQNCRKILALRFHNDLNHSQIASILHITVVTSRQWLKRCLDQLREMIKAESSL
jgi:RNA polymerase sigma factor (sigma-70 family)